jgi:hypothetical protein
LRELIPERKLLGKNRHSSPPVNRSFASGAEPDCRGRQGMTESRGFRKFSGARIRVGGHLSFISLPLKSLLTPQARYVQ